MSHRLNGGAHGGADTLLDDPGPVDEEEQAGQQQHDPEQQPPEGPPHFPVGDADPDTPDDRRDPLKPGQGVGRGHRLHGLPGVRRGGLRCAPGTDEADHARQHVAPDAHQALLVYLVPVQIAVAVTPDSAVPLVPAGGPKMTAMKSQGPTSMFPVNVSWIPDQVAPRWLPGDRVPMVTAFKARVATGITVEVADWSVDTTTWVMTHRWLAWSGSKFRTPFPLPSRTTDPVLRSWEPVSVQCGGGVQVLILHL